MAILFVGLVMGDASRDKRIDVYIQPASSFHLLSSFSSQRVCCYEKLNIDMVSPQVYECIKGEREKKVKKKKKN
jgi:hypothetical protein